MGFEFPDDQKAAFQEVFTDIINVLGKSCKLTYQPKLVPCECATLVSGPNSNFALHGGNVRVDQNGVCGLCGGVGTKEQSETEVIKLTIDWTPKTFLNYDLSIRNPAPAVNLPFQVIVTRGKIENLPKVRQCVYMEIQTPLGGYGMGKYTLRGDGTDGFNAIQDKYFLQVWERVA